MTESTQVEPVYPANSPYCWNIMQTLDKIRRENLLSDVTLNVEGQTFATRRCVLAASSKFFHSLFTNDMKEKSASIVSLEGIPVMVMDQLLSYLYTGEIKVSEANAEDLRELTASTPTQKHCLQIYRTTDVCLKLHLQLSVCREIRMQGIAKLR